MFLEVRMWQEEEIGHPQKQKRKDEDWFFLVEELSRAEYLILLLVILWSFVYLSILLDR